MAIVFRNVHHHYVRDVFQSSLDGPRPVLSSDDSEATAAEVIRVVVAGVGGVVRDEDDRWPPWMTLGSRGEKDCSGKRRRVGPLTRPGAPGSSASDLAFGRYWFHADSFRNEGFNNRATFLRL